MRWLSAGFVALAGVCWGLSGGIGAVLMESGHSAFIVSFYRGAVGLCFVLAWLALRPGGSGLGSLRLWAWSVLAGLGVAGNFVFYFIGIGEGSVAVTATLMYCAPVFVYLLSFALGLERRTPLKWAGIAIAMMGVALLTGLHDVSGQRVTPIAAAAGLLSGLSYVAFIFGFKGATEHGSPQAILTIAFAALTGVLLWLVDAREMAAVLTASQLPLFLLLGVVGAGISFILYLVGLRHTPPTVASVLAMVEPVTASLFGVIVLSERLGGIQILGMGLILLAVTALSVMSGSRFR